MAEIPDLWWSPSLGVLQRHDDGFYPLDGMTAPTFHQPEDADRLRPENRAKRQSEEIALDALQRAVSEVLDILGPRYNTGGVHYSMVNLAKKAAADLDRLDKIRDALVNHAAHAMPYALLHSIHEVVENATTETG